MELFLPPKDIQDHKKIMTTSIDKDEKRILAENSRKRCYPKEEAMSLDAKLTATTNKIIKMKVNNDAIIGQLQQQIKDAENIRDQKQERIFLQQKQIEALAEDFKKEKRLREDIQIKVDNNREIFDVLKDHMEKLAKVLTKFDQDRATLSNSYQKAIEIINAMKTEHLAKEQRNKIEVEKLQQNLTNERHMAAENQKNWAITKQCHDELVQNLKESINCKTTSFAGEKEALLNQVNNLMKDIDTYKRIQNQCEQKLKSIQENFKNTNDKLSQEISNKNCLIKKYENEMEQLKCNMNNCISEKEECEKIIANMNAEGNNKYTALNEEISKLSFQKEIVENELKAVKAANDAARKNENMLDEKINNQKNKIISLEDEIRKKNSKIEELADLLATNENLWKHEKNILENELKKLSDVQQEEMNLNISNQAKISNLEIELQRIRVSQQIENQNKASCINSLEHELQNKSNALQISENQVIFFKEQCDYYSKSLEKTKNDNEEKVAELHIYMENLREKNELIKLSNNKIKQLEENLLSKSLECDELVKRCNSDVKKISTIDIAIQTMNIERSNSYLQDYKMPSHNSPPLDEDCGMLSDSSYNSMIYDSSFLKTVMDKLEISKPDQAKSNSQFLMPSNPGEKYVPMSKKRTKKAKITEIKEQKPRETKTAKRIFTSRNTR